ncbi:MAG: 3'(2'),5'-bisphosphate nucleotidase CysQ [Planctomycetes bacterium]|nr:3'(2'),5'-bisphosphate nucleotidase CysQ [Planctomycetota bacterium]
MSTKAVVISPVSLDELERIVLSAGRMLRERQEQSTGKEAVTVDKEIDDYLKERLAHLFPEAGWLSEETKDSKERLEKSWVWIVDPLDGTREYNQNLPEYAVSVGLAFRGEVEVGAVYNPATDEGAIAAVTAKRLLRIGETKAPLRSPSGRHGVIPISRNESGKDDMNKLLRGGLPLIPVGSIAYRIYLVAVARAMASITLLPKSEWDICGGVALLKAVGLEYRRIDGRPVTFNMADPLLNSGAIIGIPAQVDSIIETIRSLGLG